MGSAAYDVEMSTKDAARLLDPDAGPELGLWLGSCAESFLTPKRFLRLPVTFSPVFFTAYPSTLLSPPLIAAFATALDTSTVAW
jgi:hypothetical protein